jgi:hypothetical protein
LLSAACRQEKTDNDAFLNRSSFSSGKSDVSRGRFHDFAGLFRACLVFVIIKR